MCPTYLCVIYNQAGQCDDRKFPTYEAPNLELSKTQQAPVRQLLYRTTVLLQVLYCKI